MAGTSLPSQFQTLSGSQIDADFFPGKLREPFTVRTAAMRDLEVDTNALDWSPTNSAGVYRKVLRNDAETGARAVLLKFDANTVLPKHMHPAGEEVFVLEGRVRFEDSWYEAGYYLYSPPGSSDDVFTDTGAILFVSLPKPHVDLE